MTQVIGGQISQTLHARQQHCTHLGSRLAALSPLRGRAYGPSYQCETWDWSSSLGTVRELQSCPLVLIEPHSPVSVMLVFSMEPCSHPCT